MRGIAPPSLARQTVPQGGHQNPLQLLAANCGNIGSAVGAGESLIPEAELTSDPLPAHLDYSGPGRDLTMAMTAAFKVLGREGQASKTTVNSASIDDFCAASAPHFAPLCSSGPRFSGDLKLGSIPAASTSNCGLSAKSPAMAMRPRAKARGLCCVLALRTHKVSIPTGIRLIREALAQKQAKWLAGSNCAIL